MQYRIVDLNGPVGYADYGGNGPTLVLVHGLAGAYINWMAVAPKLAESYHVLAVDLIGFGRTPLAGRTADVETNLELAERFVQEVAGGASLVIGHSMGGFLTLALAAGRPELVTAAVAVSAASPPGDKAHPMPPEEEALIQLLIADPENGAHVAHSHISSVGPEALVEGAFDYMCSRPVSREILDAHIELESERIKTSESTLAYLQAYKSLKSRGDEFEAFDEIVRSIKAPTLVVHGLQDPVVPADNMLRAVRNRPDWEAAWLDGVGHNVQMEAPEEFLAVVEPFLAAHAAVAPAARPA